MTNTTKVEIPTPSYAPLYRTGGAAALIAALIFRRNLDAEFMLLRGSGVISIGPAVPPVSTANWFTLLQSNPLLGLTLLNLFDVVNYVLAGLIFLSLFIILKKTHASWMYLAAFLGFLAISNYLASNQAFAMLSLSKQYAAASSDPQRTMLLAAGQAVLAVHNSNAYAGTGVYPSFLLISISGLILSLVMLRSEVFNKTTARMGILANGSGLGYYFFLLFAPGIVFLPLSISAIFLWIWYIRIAARLFQLGKAE